MKKSKKATFFIVALITFALFALALFGLKIGDLEIKGSGQMRFGIDIRGGVDATFEPRDLDRMPTESELEAARAIIETRMDASNITDRDVTIDKVSGQILVRFPWKSDEADFDPQKAVTELGETAKLTFRDPDGNVVLEGTDVVRSAAQVDESGLPVVALELSGEGAEKFAEATGRLVGQPISIYMDENEISSPIVQQKIAGGKAVINNMHSFEEAVSLANKINSGALPFSLVVKNCSIISPTLGSNALRVTVIAGIAAFAAVCLFMLLYYRLLGVVACIALLLQVGGQLLALSVPQFTLTLPGIAGIILSIGMGVDANVIVSERIKEELRAGRQLRSAVEAGFHKAFSSVFDGNITVIIVAIVLIILGSGSMLSFGYTLLTGVIMNFLAGITASRLMISSLCMYKPLQKPGFFGVRKAGEKPAKERVIPFYKKKVVFFAISLAVIAVGIVFALTSGIKLDIQFQGGSILKYTYSGEIDAEQAEDVVEKVVGVTTNGQLQNNLAKDEQLLILSLANNQALTSEQQQAVTAALNEAFADNQLTLSEALTVEAFVGSRFFGNGLLGIAISFALILVYVGFRFRNIGGISAGVMAIVALLHDAFVVTAAFVIFGIPLNDQFIAAILTIIGFSINDTIVIYDRIRENERLLGRKMPIEELVDKSITQSMSRSINTNIAVLACMVIVYIFAQIYNIESIRQFALPMMFGVVSGCYSTICIAGPLWVMWKNRGKPELAKS